ncbi:MAG: hypothetical protein EZS28_018825 [Streblomastix strix]|uniref:Uncharacterized protein n=1 Tax=Streblomastix strix TaxID=222440 RepID=A0A5J4VSQ9_9EUKA|nr:MAG: hypothetical protein EZS28_018825 [Streblomastix strix]
MIHYSLKIIVKKGYYWILRNGYYWIVKKGYYWIVRKGYYWIVKKGYYWIVKKNVHLIMKVKGQYLMIVMIKIFTQYEHLKIIDYQKLIFHEFSLILKMNGSGITGSVGSGSDVSTSV